MACGRYLAALPQVSGPYNQSALARVLHGFGLATVLQLVERGLYRKPDMSTVNR